MNQKIYTKFKLLVLFVCDIEIFTTREYFDIVHFRYSCSMFAWYIALVANVFHNFLSAYLRASRILQFYDL